MNYSKDFHRKSRTKTEYTYIIERLIKNLTITKIYFINIMILLQIRLF